MVISRKAAMDTEAVQTTNNNIIVLAISRNIVNWFLTIKEYVTKTPIVAKPLSKVKKHLFACCANMICNHVKCTRETQFSAELVTKLEMGIKVFRYFDPTLFLPRVIHGQSRQKSLRLPLKKQCCHPHWKNQKSNTQWLSSLKVQKTATSTIL